MRLKPDNFASKFQLKTYVVLSMVSLILYILIISVGFVNISEKLETYGASSMDLQDAKSRYEVDRILNLWGEEGINIVIQLTLLDYLFIITGLILFLSLNFIIYQKLEGESRRKVPVLGMYLTIISRSLDTIENTIAMTIYLNPEGYSTLSILLLSIVQNIKWVAVGIEFTLLLLGAVLLIIQKFNSTSN